VTDVIKVLTNLGAVTGAVVVVYIMMTKFIGFLEGERTLREKMAVECHSVTREATGAIRENSVVTAEGTKVSRETREVMIETQKLLRSLNGEGVKK